MPDTAAATARFLAGDLDVTDRFQVDDLRLAAREPGRRRCALAPYFGTFMLAHARARAPPFDDVRAAARAW